MYCHFLYTKKSDWTDKFGLDWKIRLVKSEKSDRMEKSELDHSYVQVGKL